MNSDRLEVTPPSLRERLKKSTSGLHVTLEKTSLAQSLANATISRPQYEKYLLALSLFHGDVELMILKMGEWKHYDLDISLHLRLPLLLADIKALKIIPPRPINIPDLEMSIDFPTAVGVMYVLEGSTMGGRFLSQRLTHLCDDNGIPATRYFQAYGEETMKRWQEYCLFLDRFGTEHPEMEDRVVDAACTMFVYMEKMMHELD